MRGRGRELDEYGRKNDQPQSNTSKDEPELPGGCGLLKHQSEDVVGRNDSSWVEANLGRLDMRVYAKIGRGMAALVYEAKALLAECWRPVRFGGSAGTATQCRANNKRKKQGAQLTAVRSVSHVSEVAVVFALLFAQERQRRASGGGCFRTSRAGCHWLDECLSAYGSKTWPPIVQKTEVCFSVRLYAAQDCRRCRLAD